MWRFQKTKTSRSDDSKLPPPTLGGFCWGRFKDDTGNVVLAPDRSANVERAKVVQAEFELVRQSLGYESKLDTNTNAGEIVNSAMVNGRTVNQDPCRVISLGALRSPIFHLMVRLLRVRSRRPVHSLENLSSRCRVSKTFVGNSLTRQAGLAGSFPIDDQVG